jgi:hypothetical protein
MRELGNRIIGCGLQAGLTVGLLILGLVLFVVIGVAYWIIAN